MEKLINIIQIERSSIGLMHDVLSTLWVELALNEGLEEMVGIDYLAYLIQKTSIS